VEVFSFDHDVAEFVAVGTATVTAVATGTDANSTLAVNSLAGTVNVGVQTPAVLAGTLVASPLSVLAAFSVGFVIAPITATVVLLVRNALNRRIR